MAAHFPGFGDRADFSGRIALVCGARVAGASAARALLALGAQVLVTDSGPPEIAQNLPPGAEFLGAIEELPAGLDVVVTSPGLRPDNPLLLRAVDRGIPVLGELEFAWRIRGDQPARWLMVTGTNGKTTAVHMLEAMLQAGGLRALAVGNVGEPIIDAVLAEPAYDVLAVEASSFQLHHSATIQPHAGAILNLAPDHLDWHGSMEAYQLEKAKVWRGLWAIANADDRGVMSAFDSAPAEHRRTFTTSVPAAGQFGIRDGVLIDGAGDTLIAVPDIRPPGLHNAANALAAAALAETVGVEPAAIGSALRSFEPDPHRNEFIATVSGVQYVDDSKATNPHAAEASLAAYEHVVWVAGGQLKDAPVEELVRRFANRLRGVVLLGADREVIASALSRHASDVPVITVSRTDDGAMTDVVRAAASLATAGDVVLLAPAAASLDMYRSYSARGEAFRVAVGQLAGSVIPGGTESTP